MNGGERQALNFGLEPRDFIGQHGGGSGTPHGPGIIVEAGATGAAPTTKIRELGRFERIAAEQVEN